MPTRGLASVLVWCLALAVAPAMAAEPELTPFVAEALWAPNPASGSDGRRHLVYELRIANTTGSGLELKKVEVLDEPSGRVLLSLDRDGLGKRFSIGGRRGAEATDLGVGQFGVLFLHVALEPGDALPRAIAHRISLRLAQPGSTSRRRLPAHRSSSVLWWCWDRRSSAQATSPPTAAAIRFVMCAPCWR